MQEAKFTYYYKLFTRTGVLKLFETRPFFIMQTKLAPLCIIPTKPFTLKNLIVLNRTTIIKFS